MLGHRKHAGSSDRLKVRNQGPRLYVPIEKGGLCVHRSFNREGQAFDKGETFSGVPYDVALIAVDELRPLVPHGSTMAAFALRWILMQQAVTVVIPGSKSPAQSQGNAAALALPPLSAETMTAARDIYSRLIAPHVHQHW